MPSEMKKLRTVPKYRIVAKVLEACPMVVKAKVYVYEITGVIGQYRLKFTVNTSQKDIETLDRDLEQLVVTLPDYVRDMSKKNGEVSHR